MGTASTKGSLGELPSAFMNLLNAQMKLTADLFESLTGQSLPSPGDLGEAGRRLTSNGSCGSRGGCCHIPPPCWMPQPLGECTSHVSQCGSACIRFAITNCDRIKRTLTVQASGAQAGTVTISPPTLALGPQERGTVTACVSIPDSAKDGEKIETLLWVRGCKDWFFRWIVSVGTVGFDSCHEVEVCDCPDYLHHWYDHFYCIKPCRGAGRITGNTTNVAGAIHG